MTNLLNTGTGKVDQVDPLDVPSLLAAGTHQPPGGARALIAPGGGLHIIPLDQLGTAAAQGFKVPTPDQMAGFVQEARYGGGANTAKAFAAGAGRGATLGLSDAALTGSGLVAPETLQGLRDVHPVTSIGGELAGAVGGALLGNELTPAGLVADLGTSVAARLAPEGAGILRQTLGHAAAAGLEGGLYGAGQAVSESALGDPNANAEHLLANVGLGAALGGGLGAIFKAGQLALPASLDKARGAVARGWRFLWGDAAPAAEEPLGRRAFFRTAELAEPELGLEATGTDGAAAPDLSPPGPPPPAPAAGEPVTGVLPKALANMNEALTGTPAEQTLAAFQKRAAGQGEILTPEQRAKFHGELNDSMQDTYDAMEKASIEASSTVRPQESAALLEAADPAPALAELQRVKGVMQATIAEMQTAPELYPARFPAKLDQVLEGLEAGEHEGASAADVYKEITRARQAIDAKIPWNKELSGEAADAVSLTKQLRAQLKASLEQEQVWGQAAARTSAFNDSVNDRLAALKEFRTQFMRKVPTRSGGVRWKINPRKTSEFLNQINDPRGQMRADSLREFFRTSLKHVGEMEKTYAATPFESFDKAALESLVEKNIAQATRAQNVVAAQPGMGFGGLGNLARLAVAGHFGGPIGAVLAAGKSALKPDAMAAGLANVERASMATDKAIRRTMKAIFEPAGAAARKGLGVLSETLTPAEKLEKIKRQVNETQDHVSSAQSLVDTLGAATRPGMDAAPKTMAAVQQTMARGLQFLQSKLPPPPSQNPFEPPGPPPTAALQAFGHYYRVVHDPLSVLDELKAGRLAPESVEALRAVYPHLHQEIAQAALERVGQQGEVPYRTRVLLSRFLGEPLDRSLTPQALRMVQAAGALADQQQGGGAAPGPRPTAKGMAHLNVAERAATDFQKTSMTKEA